LDKRLFPRKDGAEITGHPLLVPAAIDAVQQWRYVPSTVGGKPADVQAKVFVTFALNAKNEQ
jgi:protein TonB